MFHIALFSSITTMLALFAFATGRADHWIVAVPAALLALWSGDLARQGVRRMRSKGHSTRSDDE